MNDEFDLEKYKRFLSNNLSSDERSHWSNASPVTFTLFSVLMDQDLRELVFVLEHYPSYIPLVCEHFRYSYGYNENESDILATSRLLSMGEPYSTKQFARNVLAKLPKLNSKSSSEVASFVDTLLSQIELHHPLVLDYYCDRVAYWIQKNSIHKLQQIAIEKKLQKLSPNIHVDISSSDRDRDIAIPYLS